MGVLVVLHRVPWRCLQAVSLPAPLRFLTPSVERWAVVSGLAGCRTGTEWVLSVLCGPAACMFPGPHRPPGAHARFRYLVEDAGRGLLKISSSWAGRRRLAYR